MDNYFNEYKKNKILLLKLFEKAQEELIYVQTEEIIDDGKINLNNFTEKEYIKNLFDIKNDVLTNEELNNLIEKIKKEKPKKINYEKENNKILLAMIYLIEDFCKFDINKEKIKQHNKGEGPLSDFAHMLNNVEFLDSDIDEFGAMHMYMQKGSITSDIFKKFGFYDILIPKSSLDKVKEDLINNINKTQKLD